MWYQAFCDGRYVKRGGMLCGISGVLILFVELSKVFHQGLDPLHRFQLFNLEFFELGFHSFRAIVFRRSGSNFSNNKFSCRSYDIILSAVYV